MFIGSVGAPRGARLPTSIRRGPSIPVVPSWVPDPGQSITHASGGAVLTNTWRSTHITEDEFYSSKMRNAYSGTFVHPTWRGRGGMVLVGGGHANTNYNGIHIIGYGADTLTFERVLDPTNWTAGDTGDISAEFNSYGEKISSSPLQVTQGHSYGMRAIVGGKLVSVIRQAFMVTGGGDTEAQAYHTLDLTNPDTASSARAWVRETDTLGAWANTSPPGFLAYAASQERLYYMTRANAPTLRWFDLTSEAWVTGDNTGWGYPSADSDGGDPVTGTLFAVPERNLVVAAYRQSGNLVLQYIQTTSSQPTVATASLGTSLALPVEGGKAVCWCSRNSRILVFGVTSNTDRCYEVTIPATLTDSWTVDSAVIGGAGAIDPVSIMTRAGWGCEYHDGTRSVMLVHDIKHASSSPDTIDRVTVYRPRNT